MITKRGSSTGLVIIISIVLLLFVINYFVFSHYFYSKNEINKIIAETKQDITASTLASLSQKADKPGCKVVEVDFSKDSHKTDTQICSQFNKTPQLRIYYREKQIFKGTPGTLSGGTTEWCGKSRLVYSGLESYVALTNIGSEIGNLFDSGCMVIDPLNGLAEIVKETPLGIICC